MLFIVAPPPGEPPCIEECDDVMMRSATYFALDQNSKGVLLGNLVIFGGDGYLPHFFFTFHIFRIQNVVLLHIYLYS